MPEMRCLEADEVMPWEAERGYVEFSLLERRRGGRVNMVTAAWWRRSFVERVDGRIE